MYLITHYDLCKLTAERFLKEFHIVLFEYQSLASREFPDVLCYKNGYTELFEIKLTKQDFKKDIKKDCRREIAIKYMPHYFWCGNRIKNIIFNDSRIQEFIKEKSHLGRRRYYVCPWGLIQLEEIKNGWGLYWYRNNKFYKKKESKNFKCDIYAELSLLAHAMRKYASGFEENILIKKYKKYKK